MKKTFPVGYQCSTVHSLLETEVGQRQILSPLHASPRHVVLNLTRQPFSSTPFLVKLHHFLIAIKNGPLPLLYKFSGVKTYVSIDTHAHPFTTPT